MTNSDSLSLEGPKVGQSAFAAQTFNSLTDTISEDFGVTQACGSITYELVDSRGDPAPSIASIVYTDGDPTFNIEVNAKEFRESAPQQLFLVL